MSRGPQQDQAAATFLQRPGGDQQCVYRHRIGEAQPGRIDRQIPCPAGELAGQHCVQLLRRGDIGLAGEHDHRPGFPRRDRRAEHVHGLLISGAARAWQSRERRTQPRNER